MITMNGRPFLRALAYALRVCPSGESASKLAHVVLIDNKIICSDGIRWHAGIVDGQFDTPRVIARESAAELVIRLEFTETISRRHSSNFFIALDGNIAEIHFGDEKNLFKLADVPVGHIPDAWVEPVPPDAPSLSEIPEVHCQHLKDMASWWRSWEKDHGSVKVRGLGGMNPIRYDITCNEEAVAVAFLLPIEHEAAQLMPDEPLFAGVNGGRVYGQSILDLSFELPPASEKPVQTIKIGETELNVTGLGDPDDLLRMGPCTHRDEEEACLLCTESAISEAREKQQAEAKDNVVPIGKSKRGKKSNDEEQNSAG